MTRQSSPTFSLSNFCRCKVFNHFYHFYLTYYPPTARPSQQATPSLPTCLGSRGMAILMKMITTTWAWIGYYNMSLETSVNDVLAWDILGLLHILTIIRSSSSYYRVSNAYPRPERGWSSGSGSSRPRPSAISLHSCSAGSSREFSTPVKVSGI